MKPQGMAIMTKMGEKRELRQMAKTRKIKPPMTKAVLRTALRRATLASLSSTEI